MPQRKNPSSPQRRRSSLGRDLATIRRSLSSIGRALSRLGPALEAATAARSTTPVAGRRQPTITPARRKALAWQGQYMSYVRELGPRAKAKVKALREKKGVEAAVRLAKSLAKR